MNIDTEPKFEPVNFRKLLSMASNAGASKVYKKEKGFQTSFFNPYTGSYYMYTNLKTVDRYANGDISCQTLRRVSKKAFIINICINHILKKIKPYLKPTTDNNIKGFVIKEKGSDLKSQMAKKSKKRREIEDFLNNCGVNFDSERDNFQRFCLKIIRDELELDQVATEIGFTKGGKPYAFQAVDAGTIHKVIPGQDNPENIKFIQVIDGIPQALYKDSNLIFDYQNPRTDIKHAYYGYSIVDQVIDLVTSLINTFSYNAGFFTENKLPRGMLLIDGNVSQDTVEAMEDYIAEVMSGSATSQWRVPIIPSGGTGENSQSIKWVSLAGNAKDMEFQQFLDYQTSGIVAMFGLSMEELGLQSQKSQAVFESSRSTQIQESKATLLGDMLGFLQNYINRIIERFYPDYELEFVGYEKEDPKQLLDLTKTELDSFKTLNEVRQEKGLPKLEADWADSCPANPQFTQMYQAAQAQEQGGDGGFGEEGGDFGEGGEDSFSEDEFDNPAEENSGENEEESAGGDDSFSEDEFNKSIQKSFLTI